MSPATTASPKPIIIRGGRIIDPATGLDAPRDLLLRDGKIAAIESPGRIKAPGAEIIDAKGMIVAPGLIDIHIHLREPGQGYKETIATGTAAAAAGGFTTVCAMPNTIPVNDTPEITRWMQAPERGAAVRVFPIAAATRGSLGEALTDYAALKEAGAVAVTDDGKPILGDSIMLEALRAAAKLGLPVIQHAEDTRLTGGCSMNAGALAFRLGLRGMPVEAESGLVERDIALLKQVKNGHLHVAHLSTKKALDAVRDARKQGLHVTCEVTPHHFALTEERIGLYDTNAKMNPPLRAESDRAAMIEGLLDGTIDAIATDHAPHAPESKDVPFDLAPPGMLGLQTALPIAWQVLSPTLGPARIFALMSATPAAIARLRGTAPRPAGHSAHGGPLEVGAAANVCVFAPSATTVVDPSRLASRSRNTPYAGRSFTGAVRHTILRGEPVVIDAVAQR